MHRKNNGVIGLPLQIALELKPPICALNALIRSGELGEAERKLLASTAQRLQELTDRLLEQEGALHVVAQG